MKPFSLKHALAGALVVTRNGRKVIYVTELEGVKVYPVVGLVEGTESIAKWTKDGYFLKTRSPHKYDLFVHEVKKSIWVNIYDNKSRMWCSYGHNSPEEAEEANKRTTNICDSVYIKTVEITNEL
jgi:hypothetical protein